MENLEVKWKSIGSFHILPNNEEHRTPARLSMSRLSPLVSRTTHEKSEESAGR